MQNLFRCWKLNLVAVTALVFLSQPHCNHLMYDNQEPSVLCTCVSLMNE